MSRLSGLCSTVACVEGVIVNPKCLVLKYYKNGDLGTALMRDNENISNGLATEFPFLLRMKYIRDACKAVSFMHKSSLCHRDLAMRNFLLSDDMEHVLLTDFSLSRNVKGNNPHVTFSSTVPIVAPPETFRNSSSKFLDEDAGGWHYSLKTDTWGLGITMFEIITKKNFKIITNYHLLPTKLPKGSLPPKYIFNKGWDLWFTIRCCWNTELEKRPWSWEVLDKVTALIKNPVDGNAGKIYYNQYSPRLACTSSSSEGLYSPHIKFTMSEFKSQITSDMDFSEDIAINDHRRTEDNISLDSGTNIRANPYPNLLRKNFQIRTPQRNSNHVQSSTGSISSDKNIVSSETWDQATNSKYCQSLDLDEYKSDVTNIFQCKDRHFFDDCAIEMIKQSEPILAVDDYEDFCNTEHSDGISLNVLPCLDIVIIRETEDSVVSDEPRGISFML